MKTSISKPVRGPSPKVLAEAKTKLQQAQALHRGGRLAQAEWLYQEVLKLHPTQLDAMQMLGVLSFQAGRMEKGIELLRKVVEVDPSQPAVHNNLGNALREMGDSEAAIESFNQAIALKPDFADAYSNRGNALNDLRKYLAAVESYDKAIILQPNHVNALNNKGSALNSLRRYEEAVKIFDRVIDLKSNLAEAYVHRAAALIGLEHFRSALQDCDIAISLDPDIINAHRNRVVALGKLGRYKEVVGVCDLILKIDPQHKNVLGERMSALLYSCEWHNYDSNIENLTMDVRQRKNVSAPFQFIAMSNSAADQLTCAQVWIGDGLAAARYTLWNNEKYKHQKIRIAYLSADFKSHATAYLMAELFELHDKEKFEIFAFSFSSNAQSEIRNRLEAAFDHFLDVNHLDDFQIAQLVREHEIDIAIDLKGFTENSRTKIFAHRPAPIQVNYLGYPGTMGSEYIDYIIADAHVVPEEHCNFYTEKVVNLPNSYQVNDRHKKISEENLRKIEFGLPEQGFVFCCFNNNYKITPNVFDVWMSLLKRIPGSVLWLLEDNNEASRNLRREAASRGVADDRLVFAPRMDLPLHLARHRLAGLFLDTLPYNAHTTTSDALWAGLPVLTCLGSTFAGRVSASLLHAADMSELVTNSLLEYEELAYELATQPEKLIALKQKLLQQQETCSLFDTDKFRKYLECAYTMMHQRYQDGLTPQNFSVPSQF